MIVASGSTPGSPKGTSDYVKESTSGNRRSGGTAGSGSAVAARKILASRGPVRLQGRDQPRNEEVSKEIASYNVSMSSSISRPLTAKLLNNKFEFCISKAKEVIMFLVRAMLC